MGDAPGSACGTFEGLQDPPQFVGSCTTPPDGEGNRDCVEHVTKPNAIFIATDCLRAICASAGDTWSSGHCGAGFTFCWTTGDPEAHAQSLYSTNPAACAMAP